MFSVPQFALVGVLMLVSTFSSIVLRQWMYGASVNRISPGGTTHNNNNNNPQQVPYTDTGFIIAPDWKSEASWANSVSVGTFSFFVLVFVLCHRFRWVVLRRAMFLVALGQLLQGFQLCCTRLPDPNPTLRSEITSAASSATTVVLGDFAPQHWSYTMHPINYVQGALIVHFYSPSLVLRGVAWFAATFGCAMLVPTREMYTVDTISGIFTATAVFLIYHWHIRSIRHIQRFAVLRWFERDALQARYRERKAAARGWKFDQKTGEYYYFSHGTRRKRHNKNKKKSDAKQGSSGESETSSGSATGDGASTQYRSFQSGTSLLSSSKNAPTTNNDDERRKSPTSPVKYVGDGELGSSRSSVTANDDVELAEEKTTTPPATPPTRARASTLLRSISDSFSQRLGDWDGPDYFSVPESEGHKFSFADGDRLHVDDDDDYYCDHQQEETYSDADEAGDERFDIQQLHPHLRFLQQGEEDAAPTAMSERDVIANAVDASYEFYGAPTDEGKFSWGGGGGGGGGRGAGEVIAMGGGKKNKPFVVLSSSSTHTPPAAAAAGLQESLLLQQQLYRKKPEVGSEATATATATSTAPTAARDDDGFQTEHFRNPKLAPAERLNAEKKLIRFAAGLSDKNKMFLPALMSVPAIFLAGLAGAVNVVVAGVADGMRPVGIPLPHDIILFWMPQIPDTAANYMLYTQIGLVALYILASRLRFVILRRTSILYFIIMSLRCFCVPATFPPDPSPMCKTRRHAAGATCGDLIFSGHTIGFLLSALVVRFYVRIWWVEICTWVFTLVGLFVIIASRLHYTRDVVTAIIVCVTIYHLVYASVFQRPDRVLRSKFLCLLEVDLYVLMAAEDEKRSRTKGIEAAEQQQETQSPLKASPRPQETSSYVVIHVGAEEGGGAAAMQRSTAELQGGNENEKKQRARVLVQSAVGNKTKPLHLITDDDGVATLTHAL